MSPTENDVRRSVRSDERAPRGPLDRRLIGRVPALRRHLGLSLIAAVVTAIVTIAQAETFARLLPRIIDGDGPARRSLVGALLSIAVVRGLLRWCVERSATHALRAARRDIGGLVLGHVAALDDPSRAVASPTRVAAVVTAGVDALEPWVRAYVPALCVAAFVPLAAGLRILSVDVVSAAILVVAIPLIPVFMVLIGRVTEDRTARDWASMQRLAAHFHDVLVGLPTLRLFGRAEAQIGRVRESADRYRRSAMRTLRIAFLSALVLELLATLSVALVAVSIGIRLADDRVTLRTAMLVLLLAPECSLPLRRVGAAFHAAQTGTDAADDLEALLSLGTTPDGPQRAPESVGIEVRAATVNDPTRGRRLGPVDLRVEPGELVVLRGPSGSGKSTLLDVIRGQVALDGGTVRLGGGLADELGRRARRSTIAFVAQHPAPIGDRVDSSVRLGAAAATPASVHAVLQSVDLDTAAARSPADLSGGERQRVAVARALLRAGDGTARVVLADEPTAHLDDDRANRVGVALRSLADAGRAVLVATHDPRLDRFADRAVTLGPPVGAPAPDQASAVGTIPGRRVGTPGPGAPAAPALVPGPVPGERTSATIDETRRGFGDLRWLHRTTRPVRARLVLARSLGVAAEACTVGLTATAAWLIVRAAEHPSFVDLAIAAVGVRAFGIGKGVLRYAERLAAHDATFRLVGELRSVLVGRLGVLVPAALPQLQRGEMITRVISDVDRLGDLELRVIGPATSALVVGLGATILVAAIDPATALVLAAASVLAGALVPLGVARVSARTGHAGVAATSALAARITDAVEHLDELVANDAFDARVTEADRAIKAVGDIERRRGRVSSFAQAISAALPVATAAALAWTASRPAADVSGPTLGLLALAPLALFELYTPLVTAAESVAPVAACAARMRAIVDTPDPAPEPDVPAAPPASHEVELDDLALAWPGGPIVVHDVTLRLDDGEVVTISGPSGSGKSTLAAGLVRFLVASSGAYRLGGVDSTLLGGRQVRRIVTWCPQDPWLADTTLRENLRIADPEATGDALWAALAHVQLADWATALPRGLDTPLGVNGSAASGGERHRLALARVLLAGHDVVVLDEPTAHLDAATAEAVRHELVAALTGRTIIILGHGPGASSGTRHLEMIGGRLGPTRPSAVSG